MIKYKVFVFARLKPSQINYKIIPLARSPLVEKVYLLRKTPIEVDNDKVKCFALPKIFRIRPFYWFFTAIYGAWLIRKKGADIIVSYNIVPHGFNGYVASLLTGKKFIYGEITEDTTRYYNNSFKRFIIRKIFKRADRILVPGSFIGNYWNKKGFHNTTFLHSTIDPEYFKPDLSYKKQYDFIFIGVFDSLKRPDIIIEALSGIKAKNHPDISLCMIGYGELQSEIEKQIVKFELMKNITLVTTNNVLDYLLKSKIFVMATLTEGIPCAMLEAMSCGLIVLVPPVGDISDVVKHHVNGFLHNNTLEDIVIQMMSVYNNYETLDFIRKNARETIINQHAYQVATMRWTNLLSSL